MANCQPVPAPIHARSPIAAGFHAWTTPKKENSAMSHAQTVAATNLRSMAITPIADQHIEVRRNP